MYETVKGKKLRSLAKELNCSINEALGLLVGFWLWGLKENTDLDGKIPDADRKYLARIIAESLDERYTGEQALEAMISTGWLDEVDGDLYIHDWPTWQQFWYKAVDRRKKDSIRQARYRARQASETDTPEENPPQKADSSDSKAPDPTNPTQKAAKKATNDYPTGFEEFWSAYPKKVGKGEAYKCYQARLKDGWSPEELLEAAREYASETGRRHTDKDYIKHPKTFLSATTPFTDYIKSCRQQKGQQVDMDSIYRDWGG